METRDKIGIIACIAAVFVGSYLRDPVGTTAMFTAWFGVVVGFFTNLFANLRV